MKQIKGFLVGLRKAKTVKLGLLALGAMVLLAGAVLLLSLPITKTASADSCAGSVPVYRLLQYQYPYFTNADFYTTSPTEKSDAIANLGFKDLGIAFYAFNFQAPNTVPVYRSFNSTTGTYLYTINPSERDSAAANGYAFQGIGFYVFPNQVSGSVPVYRLDETKNQYRDHAYTISAAERDNGVTNGGYTYVGIAFYAYSSPSIECNPTPAPTPTPVLALSASCNTNSDCGISGFVGGAFCQNNGVYRNYTAYTCNNAGASSAYCSSSTQSRLQQNCTNGQLCSSGRCVNVPTPTPTPTPIVTPTPTPSQNAVCNSDADCGINQYVGTPFCQGNGIYQNFQKYTCQNPGTTQAKCVSLTNVQLKTACSSDQFCQNGACTNSTPTYQCNDNSDCGTDGFTGGDFCQGNGVYQNYATYTCENPGTPIARCTNATSPQLVQFCGYDKTCTAGRCGGIGNTICSSNIDCGTNGYVGGKFCQNNGIYQNYETWTCNNPGTNTSYCTVNTQAQLQQTCSYGQNCNSGSCVVNPSPTPVSTTCSANTDCGTSGYTGGPFCQNNGVYENYVTYTCNNPGTSNSYCSNNTQTQLLQSCSYGQTCNNGSCTNNGGNCNQNAYLQCSGNSVYWFSSCGQQGNLYQTCSYNQTCQGSSCVNNNYQQTGTLTVTKQVRNLTVGNLNWSSSVSANPSDIVQFQVTVQNTSNQTISNVTLRDTMPQNLYYQNNLTIDGVSANGDITQGLNINSVAPGQTRTIDYQAQLAPAQNFAFGSTTLTNSVSATASNQLYSAPASAQIFVTRNAIYGATSVSTGLTNNFLTDSFLLPLMLALAGLWLLTGGTFRLPKKLVTLFARKKNLKAQQRLEDRITEIRAKEAI